MDEKEAIQLLRKHATSEDAFEKVLSHSRAVQKIALAISEKISATGKTVDIEFVRTASLLHDIGRFRCPPGKESIKHGIIGAEIIRQEKLDDRYARVCERHLGAGIPAEEVVRQGLPIPEKDYMPETTEEKIITYADNLIAGEKVMPPEYAIKRFTDEVGPAAGELARRLHEEVQALMQR